MFILDTNTISFSVYHPASYPLLMKNIRATKPADRWISVVTAHELIAFKYEKIAKTKSMARAPLLKTYHDFDDILKLLCKFQIKPFDEDAYSHFTGMPGNIDIHDRRIAATALANNFTVVSHDGDFEAIKIAKPALRLEDWVVTDYTARRR